MLVGSPLALRYLRPDWVAPLGSSALVFNFIFARWLVGTRECTSYSDGLNLIVLAVTATDIRGTAVIVMGVILIMVFSSINHGLQQSISLERYVYSRKSTDSVLINNRQARWTVAKRRLALILLFDRRPHLLHLPRITLLRVPTRFSRVIFAAGVTVRRTCPDAQSSSACCGGILQAYMGRLETHRGDGSLAHGNHLFAD